MPLKIEDEKYFAVCELSASDRVIVRLNETGNISGELPEYLSDPNSILLTIADVNRDEAVNLTWDYDKKYYTVDPKIFVPRPGQQYRLKGLSNYNANEIDPVVSVPNYIGLDSISGSYLGEESVDGVYYNVYSFATRLPEGQYGKLSFFEISPKLPSGNGEIKYVFDENHDAYKPLNHKSGFLVDYSRTINGKLSWKMRIPKKYEFNTLNFMVGNVDKTYYYYNKYRSDALSTSVNTTYVSPIIIGDGLNVVTSMAYMSFSGLAVTEVKSVIR
jgi:hypothetical protein